MARKKKTVSEIQRIEGMFRSMADALKRATDAMIDTDPPIPYVELHWDTPINHYLGKIGNWATKVEFDTKSQVQSYKGGVPSQVSQDKKRVARRKKLKRIAKKK